MKKEILYKQLCDKVGFDIVTHVADDNTITDYENDNYENPFDKLTYEELCWLDDNVLNAAQ